ncbi:hypothetical protein Dsin_011428 [Dipteronia sinensis]|uniref:Nitrate regulatory gene2 protein-like n=1 Tax=Dipteronia sinensis TaxID=43782 RepID=A0AAE0AV37_9ROSI|nr:hypothetical protein Dsin_011428 [Dipteronia sinensis]
MGCAASSSSMTMRRSSADYKEEVVDVVNLCREKKRQVKLAVKCRSAFAEAQCKYNQSLLEVAKAISLFVERHSSSSSSSPPSSPLVMITASSDDNSTERFCEEKEEQELKKKNSKGKEKVVDDDDEHLYNEIPPYQWDFFDTSSCAVFGESSLSVHQEKLIMMRKKIRDQLEEVILPPHLEEEEVLEAPTNEQDLATAASYTNAHSSNKKRELLKALKDVEDQFLGAHEAGLHLSNFLEVTTDHLEGLGGNLMTWNQTTSSSSSLSSSSTSDSPDDWGGMLISGSHKMTLVRLYEWQRKLYKQVKANNLFYSFRVYKRKCIELLNKEAKEGDGRPRKLDNIRAETKQIYSTVLVSLQSTKMISETIERIRDEELHLQLVELLNGLRKTWKVMFESHEIQGQIMLEVGSFGCSVYGKLSEESHLLASLQLLGALRKWRANFSEYVSTQKAYVRAVDGWLSRFFFSKNKALMTPPPPLLILCQNWLASLKLLPDEPVAQSLESFRDGIRALWIQQGTEKQQKRKVDKLMREFERREMEFNKSIEAKLLDQDHEQKPEEDLQKVLECLKTKKDMLDLFKDRVEIERAKHLSSIEQTKQMALTGFHTRFSSVFESLTGFSKASVNMYTDLIMYTRNASDTEEASGNSSGESMDSQKKTYAFEDHLAP